MIGAEETECSHTKAQRSPRRTVSTLRQFSHGGKVVAKEKFWTLVLVGSFDPSCLCAMRDAWQPFVRESLPYRFFRLLRFFAATEIIKPL